MSRSSTGPPEALMHLEAGTEGTMWFTVSRYRSALQVIVDDYASTPVPAWLHPDEFDEIDEQIRKSAQWQFPLAPERIPSRLAPSHWWWMLPQQSWTGRRRG